MWMHLKIEYKLSRLVTCQVEFSDLKCLNVNVETGKSYLLLHVQLCTCVTFELIKLKKKVIIFGYNDIIYELQQLWYYVWKKYVQSDKILVVTLKKSAFVGFI